MEKQMNQFLSDLVVEYHKLQNFHWNATGKCFFRTHEQLESYYNSINAAIDQVAETLLMINEQPVGRLKDFMAISKIVEFENKKYNSPEIWKEVIADFKYLLESAKGIKKAADKQECFIVSALMDNYIADFSKYIWMIGQLI